MMNLLLAIGCVWARKIKATLDGKLFDILLGYIINEEQVAVPYAAVVDGRLTETERQELKENLRLSQPPLIGELEDDCRWTTWNGCPLSQAPPKIDSPYNVMKREADINMVWIELFTSLKGMPPKILRELINAGLLTRIYLYRQNKADWWEGLKEQPEQFPLLVMQAMRDLDIPQISFLPYAKVEVVKKLVEHISVLPLQSYALAKSYLALSMEPLKQEFQIAVSPSYCVEEVLSDMKEKDMIKGHVIDLSSTFASKLLYCSPFSEVTQLTGVEESSHSYTQAKLFCLLLGDQRLNLKEQWDKNDKADTVIAELNIDNIFRLIPEVSSTLRHGGYGCWFMESKLRPLASALFHTDSSNYQLIKEINYESSLGDWTAFIFNKPEED